MGKKRKNGRTGVTTAKPATPQISIDKTEENKPTTKKSWFCISTIEEIDDTTSKAIYNLEANLKRYPFKLPTFGEKEINGTQDIDISIRGESCPCGIYSSGQTCYLNTSIQTLNSIIPLRNAIYAVTPQDNLPPYFYLLQRLFADLDMSIRSAVSADSFVETLLGEQRFHQQDPFEFFLLFKNRLEEKNERLRMAFDDAFISKIETEIQCKTCDSISKNSSTDSYLLFPVTDSLSTSFEKCFDSDNLVGENAYFCSNCNHKCEAKRTIRLEKSANVIVVMLQRFTDTTRKNKKRIRFPFHSFPQKNTKSASITNDETYELTSVWIHIGDQSSGGHYICHRKFGDQWFEINDRQVTRIELFSVGEPVGENPKWIPNVKDFCQSTSAYIVVYQKKEYLNTVLSNPPKQMSQEISKQNNRLVEMKQKREQLIKQNSLLRELQEFFAKFLETNGETELVFVPSKWFEMDEQAYREFLNDDVNSKVLSIESMLCEHKKVSTQMNTWRKISVQNYSVLAKILRIPPLEQIVSLCTEFCCPCMLNFCLERQKIEIEKTERTKVTQLLKKEQTVESDPFISSAFYSQFVSSNTTILTIDILDGLMCAHGNLIEGGIGKGKQIPDELYSSYFSSRYKMIRITKDTKECEECVRMRDMQKYRRDYIATNLSEENDETYEILPRSFLLKIYGYDCVQEEIFCGCDKLFYPLTEYHYRFETEEIVEYLVRLRSPFVLMKPGSSAQIGYDQVHSTISSCEKCNQRVFKPQTSFTNGILYVIATDFTNDKKSKHVLTNVNSEDSVFLLKHRIRQSGIFVDSHINVTSDIYENFCFENDLNLSLCDVYNYSTVYAYTGTNTLAKETIRKPIANTSFKGTALESAKTVSPLNYSAKEFISLETKPKLNITRPVKKMEVQTEQCCVETQELKRTCCEVSTECLGKTRNNMSVTRKTNNNNNKQTRIEELNRILIQGINAIQEECEQRINAIQEESEQRIKDIRKEYKRKIEQMNSDSDLEMDLE